MAQSRAFVSGRDYVIPEDIKHSARRALPHRLALDTRAKYSGVRKEDVVQELLDSVPVGV
jgi:MoxR-like ATPase